MPKTRTFRDEVALTTFLGDNNIPAALADIFRNNSGGLGVVFENAADDRGTVVYGTDGDTGATADAASYAAAVIAQEYTSAINVANAKKLILQIDLVTKAVVDLSFGLRGSFLGEPDIDTADDWSRMLTDDGSSTSGAFTYSAIEGTIPSALMNVDDAKYLLEIDVQHVNWLSIVFWDGGAAEITVTAEVAS